MTQTHFTIDEITVDASGGRVARLVGDDGTAIVLVATLLPTGARTGDVVTLTIALDTDATAHRRNQVLDLQRKLFG